MTKVLFFIHDLGSGGAERVLADLVNCLDKTKFSVTVLSIFGGGVNEKKLDDSVKYISKFKKSIPGNSKLFKLFSPSRLYNFFIKEKYDIVISFVEGSCARIVSGCPDDGTKLAVWVHGEQTKSKVKSFRSVKEACKCYSRFDKIVCVAETLKEGFYRTFNVDTSSAVIYNVVDNKNIAKLASESAEGFPVSKDEFNIVAVGSLKKIKGFDRLIRIHKRLIADGKRVHTYVIGNGPEKDDLTSLINENGITDSFSLLGYKENPYKYVSESNLFVCSSYSEGFSTAVTEALIVGTPVCTVKVSGMKELLGDNEYGVICENEEDSLYNSLKIMIDDSTLYFKYKERARIRGLMFNKNELVKKNEEFLENLANS